MTDTSFDYGESDDWVWGYGNNKDANEYVINISGGGDGVSPNGFENWVIKKVGGELKCYIRHGGDIPDKEQINKIIVSCPDGNYVSFQDKDYVFREGEIGMDWLEDELGETDERMITMIDNLSRANQFLQNIAEEQTKKIKEQEKEILSLMSLRSKDSEKLATLHNENRDLKEEVKKHKDGILSLYDEKVSLKEENEKLKKLLKESEEGGFTGDCAEVVKVTNPDKVKEIKDKGGGSLMFPTEYRKLDKDDILWDEVRKKYELKGRWEAYCHTEFGELKPKQNKDIKYKHPHFVEADWDGAYNGGVETLNNYVSDYVYGTVYLLKL